MTAAVPAKRRPWAAVSALLLTVAVAVPTADAIRNGDPDETNGTVLAVTEVDPKKTKATNMGTGFNATYNRCIVTAYHVQYHLKDHYVFLDRQVVKDVDDEKWELDFGAKKKQKIAASKGAPKAEFGGRFPWRDIGVIWLENKADTPADRRITLEDYKKGTIEKAGDWGLPAVDQSVFYDKDHKDKIKDALIRGYGYYTSVREGPNNFYKDKKGGTRRKGVGTVVAYHIGTGADMGAILRVWPKDGSVEKPINCRADSGSPLTPADEPLKFYGIAAAAIADPKRPINTPGGGGDCVEIRASYFSAFHSTGEQQPMKMGNYEIVNSLIQETCKKDLKTDTKGEGSVEGTLNTPQAPPSLLASLNNGMNCGTMEFEQQDCLEYMHEGQTMTLTATPATGWKFLRWEKKGNSQCPCENSNNEVCTVSFDAAGTYDANTSDDTSTCVAHFVTEMCGNAIMDGSEQCDAGIDDQPADSGLCDADCTLALCGDGYLNAVSGEECDDENLTNGDGCSALCFEEEYCGDEIVNGLEECDDGGASEWCDADCTASVCGDGTLNAEALENCDDGNLTNGDGCSGDCRVEMCGNGTVTQGEECYDGEATTWCDANCTRRICGDGTLNAAAGEECDDGNAIDDDGCSSECLTEDGTCGDGAVDPGEYCDTGSIDTSTCDADCTPAACGDGYWNVVNEGCDDGNMTSGDGCALCVPESGSSSSMMSQASSSLPGL